MAKQLSGFITGSYDGLCFYRMGSQYYVRMKSPLTRKRVKKSAAFRRTMESAGQLATASVIASGVYRKIVKEKRKVDLYRKMVGMAKLLLKSGTDKEKIFENLSNYAAMVLETAVTKNKKNSKIIPVKRSIALFKPLPRCSVKTINASGPAYQLQRLHLRKGPVERKTLYWKEQAEVP